MLLCWPVDDTAGRSQAIGDCTIGVGPVKEIRTYLPFAKYLVELLQSHGVDDCKIVIARDIDYMAKLLRDGAVDLFVDSPLVAMAINQKAGSRLLARRRKKGVSEYHSVVFVPTDSGLPSPELLGGHVIAFAESFSTGGHLLPRLTLDAMELSVVQVSAQAKPPDDRAGFVFLGDDENTMEWVLRGRVDAGAMSMGNYLRRAAANLSELTIILETTLIPRHAVSISAAISEQLSTVISTALTSMRESGEGREILLKFEKTAKIDVIPEQTVQFLTRLQESVGALVDAD